MTEYDIIVWIMSRIHVITDCTECSIFKQLIATFHDRIVADFTDIAAAAVRSYQLSW